eukprot:4605032-Alexandrium_andersonii.AAC.1
MMHQTHTYRGDCCKQEGGGAHFFSRGCFAQRYHWDPSRPNPVGGEHCRTVPDHLTETTTPVPKAP